MREPSPKKYIPFFATLALIVAAVLAAYWLGHRTGTASAKSYRDQARVLANDIDRAADCLRTEKNAIRQHAQTRKPAALYNMLDFYAREQFCLRSNSFPFVGPADIFDVSGAKWQLEMPGVDDSIWSTFHAPASLSTPGPAGENASGIPSYRRVDAIDGSGRGTPRKSK